MKQKKYLYDRGKIGAKKRGIKSYHSEWQKQTMVTQATTLVKNIYA